MNSPKWITRFMCKSKLLITVAALLCCGSTMGQEQNKNDQDEFTLEEIIVTAEFREKEVQKTPLSITAISGDMLEMRNHVSLEQIALESPNVSLRPGNAAFGSSLAAYIRGIGQADMDPSVEAGVGIYVDDVYYSTLTGNVLDLLDLERVEVLRGPQGTLAGRNALGGAIKLFSRKPEGRNEGYFSATYGKFDRLDIRGAGDFSITDKLFVRVAGTSRSRDGYVTSYDYACYNNTPNYGEPGGMPTYITLGRGGSDCVLGTEGGQSMTAGRLSIRWIPNDNFEVNFATNIVNDNSEGIPNVLIAGKDLSTAPIPIYFDNNGNGVFDEGIDVTYGNQFATGGTYMNYSTYIDNGKSTPTPGLQGGTPGQDMNVFKPVFVPRVNSLDAKDYTLNIDWRLTDNVALKSITAYREYTNIFGDDTDVSPLAAAQGDNRMEHDQWTQEFRLNATLFDGFADTTIGVFYLDQNTAADARIDINYIALDFLHGPDDVPAKSKAVYGQSNLHLTDKLNLSLGLRYSEDEKSYTFRRHNIDGSEIQFPTGPPFLAGQPTNSQNAGLNGLSVAYSSSNVDYRAALDYEITDKVMVYGQVASGYRAGGNNARPFFPQQLYAFEPETMVNYEVGLKSTLFNQLRFNTSLFFSDYKDMQLPVNTCFFAPEGFQFPCATQANVGDGEIKGLEVEGTWRPNEAFSIDFSYSYVDFKYTRVTDDPNTGEPLFAGGGGNRPYTPKHKWSIGEQYRINLGKWGDLTERLDLSWQDDTNASLVASVYGSIPSYYLLNGRLTWRSQDLKWQASLEATNLTDEYYYLTIFDLYNITGIANGQPGRPQEWAFTIKRVWYFD